MPGENLTGSGPVYVDGSWGEGGGQILRTALTLSLLTGRPVLIDRVRAGRPQPGLRAQHLAAVEAAATVSGGRVEGAAVGSQTVRLFPGRLRPGDYHFRIGTAGAASLVLQTVLPALALAEGDSTVTVSGGTHVPWAPTFDYLRRHWSEVVRRLGLEVELTLEHAGFYPTGGGVVRARVSGRWQPRLLEPDSSPEGEPTATERGSLVRSGALSLVCNLPRKIAERQARELQKGLHRLGLEGPAQAAGVEVIEPQGRSPGTAVYVEAVFERGRGAATALGRRGKPAEQVAREALNELARYLQSEADFDYHLADQLLLPLALAPGPSRFTTSAVSQHLLTNARVINLFLGPVVQVRGEVGRPGEVRVNPAGA